MTRKPTIILTLGLALVFLMGMNGCPEIDRLEDARDEHEVARLAAEDRAEHLTNILDDSRAAYIAKRDELSSVQREQVEQSLTTLQDNIDAEIAKAKEERDRRDSLAAQITVAQNATGADGVGGILQMIQPWVPSPIGEAIGVGALIFGAFAEKGRRGQRNRADSAETEAYDAREDVHAAVTAMRNLDRASTKDPSGNRIVDTARARSLNGPDLSRRVERLIGD